MPDLMHTDAAQLPGPRVFISYAWEDEEYKLQVKQFATRLRSNGIDARLDAWDAKSISIPEFMNRELRLAQRVLVLCSPEYRRKVHAMEEGHRVSGSGWEHLLLTGSLFSGELERDCVSLVLFRGSWAEAAPSFLGPHPYLDLSSPDTFEENYRRLLQQLTGRAESAPPLGLLPKGIDPEPVQPMRGPPPADTRSRLGRGKRPHPFMASSAGTELESPSFWSRACDRLLPWLHGKMREFGRLATPAEYFAITEHLRELHAALNSDIVKKTYVANQARRVAAPARAQDEGPDPFVQPIHQVLREILGRSQGGDSASAQLAAVNRRSRVVQNLIRTLLTAEESLILLGDPGTGKTMTLQRAALQLIDAELRRVYPSVIVYVRLGEFHVEGTVTTQHVFDYVRRSLPEPIGNLLEALDRAGRLIILFDGLDEMSRERYTEHTEALSKFATTRCGRVKTLFSCRITDFSPSFTHQRLVLLPFDRRQILEYLRRYFAAPAVEIDGRTWKLRRLATHLAQGGFSLDATNPFVLWLLCFHLANKHAWPSSRAALLRFHLEETYKRKQKDADDELTFPPIEEALSHWGELAYLIAQRNRGTAIAADDLVADAKLPARVGEMIRLGRRCGVLAESSPQHPHLVRFDHHRLHEYFSAYYLLSNHPEMDWLSSLDAPRWQETLANLVVMGGGREAVQLLAQNIAQAINEQRLAWQAYSAEKEKREEARKGGANSGADPEPELIEPKLGEQEELLLADRVELAARIAREANDIREVETALLPALRNAADHLAVHGNPITQVKLIRACVQILDPQIIDAVRRPLTSKVAWVRDQALILLSTNSRGLGANLAREMGYDLASGTFLTRIPLYIKAIAASRQPGAIYCLCVGLVCALAYVSLLFMASAGIYWGAVELVKLWGVGWWLTDFLPYAKQPSTMALAAVLTLGISVLTLLKSPNGLWVAVFYGPIAFLGLSVLLFGLWMGHWGVLFLALFFCLTLGALFPEAWLVAYLALLPAILSYTLLTKRYRLPDSKIRSLLACARKETLMCSWGDVLSSLLMLSALSIFPLLFLAPDLGMLILAGFGFLAWGLGSLSAVGIGLVFLFWLFDSLATLPSKIRRFWIDGDWRWKLIRGVMGTLLAIPLGLLGIFLAVAIVSGLGWAINEYLGIYAARIFAGLCFLLMAFLFVRQMPVLLRWLAVLRRRWPYPRGSFTPDEWKLRLQAAHPVKQEGLILRTNHESVSLSPQEFIDLLAEVHSLIREEPALSTYWAHRAEIEQILKQERQG